MVAQTAAKGTGAVDVCVCVSCVERVLRWQRPTWWPNGRVPPSRASAALSLYLGGVRSATRGALGGSEADLGGLGAVQWYSTVTVVCAGAPGIRAGVAHRSSHVGTPVSPTYGKSTRFYEIISPMYVIRNIHQQSLWQYANWS